MLHTPLKAPVACSVALLCGLAHAQSPRHRSDPPAASYASLAELPDWSGLWTITEASSDAMAADIYASGAGGPHTPRMRPAYEARRQASIAVDTSADPHAKLEDSNSLHCLPEGMPELMFVPSPLGYEFLFTPGRVTIIAEVGEVRRIYTDGRSHSDDPDDTYAGESIGHWEGKTLVVDTTAILPNAQLLLAVIKVDGRAHVVERIHLKDKDHLQIQTVVEDPTVLTEPWHYELEYERSKATAGEYVCEDNNRERSGQTDLTPPAEAPPHG